MSRLDVGSLLRRKGNEEHLAAVVEMTDAAFDLAKDQIRAEHPGYTEDQVHLTAIRHRVGDEVFDRAYPGQRPPDD